MTIEEAQQEIRNLSDEMSRLVIRFEADTKLYISDLQLLRERNETKSTTHWIYDARVMPTVRVW